MYKGLAGFTQELKDKWIEALRSGEYEQGRYCLYRDGSYCCLGVLKAVANYDDPTYPKNDFLEILDENGRKNCVFLSSEIQWNLSNYNDTERRSFNQIANYIEDNIEPYEESTKV
jgi:hypothetical protein